MHYRHSEHCDTYGSGAVRLHTGQVDVIETKAVGNAFKTTRPKTTNVFGKLNADELPR